MDKFLQKHNLQKFLTFSSSQKSANPESREKESKNQKEGRNSLMTPLPEIVITTPENENIPLFDENMFELFQGNKKIKDCLKLVDSFIKNGKKEKAVVSCEE